jgi:hypothetical protein
MIVSFPRGQPEGNAEADLRGSFASLTSQVALFGWNREAEGALNMCTYLTEKVEISGSGKGASGWISVTEASVYLDHPVHAPYGHTLNIDFLAPALGPSARVAVELNQESARALAKAIEAVLESAPPGLE